MTRATPFRSRKLSVGGMSKNALLRELARRHVSLNDYARALFDDAEFTVSSIARSVRVAIVSLWQLGHSEGATFGDIVRRAVDVGLHLCPLEVAPYLRLSYLDQPQGGYLTVASPPPGEGSNTPNGLYLRHRDHRLWLRGYTATTDHVYAPDFSEFVFLLDPHVAQDA